MADRDETLVVPVNVDALVVNQSVRERGGQGFRRWLPNFNLLRHNRTPEPDPFTNEEEWNDTKGTGSDDKYKQHDGVYVRWELPDALRHGGTRAEGGSTQFPLVPNRWLVVRQVTGKPELTTGWVVESDFLDPDKGTSRFMHPVDASKDPATTPYRGTVIPTRIGRAQDIGADGTAWTEPSASDASRKDMFLTAVGPGVMTFHVYQPYHENVFSLHDPLTGVDATATLNYQVVGWYSDPAQEPLATRSAQGSVESALAGFGWSVAGLPQGWTPSSTTYCGRALDVRWTSEGVPDSDLPQREDVQDKVAVGSSADEAHAALVAGARTALSADSGNGIDHTDPALLHLLGQGLLHTLDEPDGDILAAQALHKGWFQQVPGGYVWRLANTADKGNVSGDPKSVTWSGVAPEHEAWLAQLNTDQSAYDEKARELAALQKRLYALWWMHGLPLIPPQYSRERLRAEIDPANPGGLAATVAAELAEVRKRQADLAAYVNGHTLPAGYELRKETLPPFYQVTDPTVVLAGAKSHTAHKPLTKDGALICRMPSQIVSDGRANPFTSLRTGGLPPVVPALLTEFACVLDAKAGTYTPDIAPDPWRQPWKPLLFQWRVEHRQVPYGDLDDPNWAFDGSRYTWRKGDAVTTPIEVTGRRFLVPLPQHTLGGGLEQHAADHHDPAVAQALTAAAADIKDLDLLSQRLDGLTDTFALRDPAPNLRPPGGIGDLVGDAFHHLPDAGRLPESFKGWQPSGFTQIRAGQFAVARLSVVDEFGQTLDVLLPGDAEHFVPKVADSLLTNGKFVEPTDTERFVQLPPRLLQAARLRFDFVAEHDDEQLVDLNANTTPVGAWIVPNYVDRSLLCYAPTGEPLGELRLDIAADGSGEDPAYVIGWGPLPDSTVRTVDDLRDTRPQLYAFARELAAKGPDAFADLLATVDHALAGIDPGNPYGDEVLGALLGRPLALVRVRLGFELDGPPVTDAGWQYARDWKALTEWKDRAKVRPAPPEMAHLDYRWPVRLGNAGQKGDGLIGYFSEDDYGTFYAVAKPETQHTGYVAEVSGANWPALRADSTQRTHLTLLLDPMAAVHATTDILPVTELRLPSRFTRTAMAAMQVALRLSPVLTTTRKVPAKDVGAGRGGTPAGFVNALAMPHPTSPQGTWDWAELVVPDAPAGADPAPTWAHEPIVQIDQAARLDEDGPTVRTGFLRLSGGFGTK
ncbi:hypothetical protein [Streptomyces sp. UNOC14_S4]|uniref:hypothetical protein n=1 Tax=Streptomyces sp. UNOC14_S4 TaxID=2872340 RepID=UPI001E40CAED|nr:hypothetical protein [Streptomyces sp. UNOC14_S4]MCC3770702.1 hypothetical protein [Streptomyces sp. UNOC14_S4]